MTRPGRPPIAGRRVPGILVACALAVLLPASGAASAGAAARALYVANRPAEGPSSLAQLSVAIPGGLPTALSPARVAADAEPQHLALTSDGASRTRRPPGRAPSTPIASIRLPAR